jgi:hypothetical protein
LLQVRKAEQLELAAEQVLVFALAPVAAKQVVVPVEVAVGRVEYELQQGQERDEVLPLPLPLQMHQIAQSGMKVFET